MDSIYPVSCLAMIIFLAFAGLLVIAFKPNDKTVAERTTDKAPKRTNTSWQSWFAFISISLVIAVWTPLGALLFLLLVWLLGQNPGTGLSYTPGDKEKRSAKGIYSWLFFSPVLTVPVFIILLYNLRYEESNLNGRVLASVIPLILHLPLLLGLFSKSVFVYRHTQQSILLIGLRAGMAILASSLALTSDHGFWVFVSGNGSLWLFGSIVGWYQTSSGEYLWMKQHDKKMIAPETKKTAPQQMDKEMEDLLKSLNAREQVVTRTKTLRAFRAGTPETRKHAVEILSKLGEVETF